MLKIEGITKTFLKGTPVENNALKGIDLYLQKGDYVTVIGGNGAGKSTLLNAVAGSFFVDTGKIHVGSANVTSLPEYKRAPYLGRVFQDPLRGTVANMSIEENMALAFRRGKKRGLAWHITKKERDLYREKLSMLDLGLEKRLNDHVGLLSGGQRQALSLLMATFNEPNLLLLDEHTAALDPKTAAKVLEIGDKLIEQYDLTTLMVTHNMLDAITHGNRIIMMSDGHIVLDIEGEEKKELTPEKLVLKFNEKMGDVGGFTEMIV